MPKILSQSGISLADVYDVEGSIAGIDSLDTRELPIVHEMGGTIHSERLGGSIFRVTTGAIPQNTTWDIVSTDVGAVISRILGLIVFSDDAGRIVNAQVSVRSDAEGRELPIFAWDQNEQQLTVRIQDDGTAVASLAIMASSLNIATLPTMLLGSDQRRPFGDLAFRGLTTGFGAGDVTVTALLYRAFPDLGGVSSYGLPLPSW